MRKRLCLFLPVLFIAAEPPAAAVKPIRYDDLGAAVRQLRGKVVVVDFWADYCIPCKRAFPHLVELHRKHAKDPVAIVSVALDENSAPARQRVDAFLRSQQANFANYLLDEPPSVWQVKLKVDGPPVVFVFNKKGELAQRFADTGVEYDKIGSLVAALAKE